MLLVPTFNEFVSALVSVCSQSASCAHSITLYVRLYLSLHPLAFLFTLYMSLFWYVPNLFVCVNCILVQLFLSAHSVLFCHCVFFYPPVFLSTVLCAQVSVSDLFVSTLLLLFVPTLGVCVYSRRCLRPLCFCPLCVLLVFLSILFHTKTYEPFISGMYWHVDAYSIEPYINYVGAYCNSRVLQYIQFELPDLHFLVDQLLSKK